MKSQSVLINCNKYALSGLTKKYQKFSKTPPICPPIRSLSFPNLSARSKALNLGGLLDQEKPQILTKSYNYFATKFLARGLFLKSYSSLLRKQPTQMLGTPKILAKNFTPSWSGWFVSAERLNSPCNQKKDTPLAKSLRLADVGGRGVGTVHTLLCSACCATHCMQALVGAFGTTTFGASMRKHAQHTQHPTKTQEPGDFTTKVLVPNKTTTKAKSLSPTLLTSPKYEAFGLTSKSFSKLLSNNSLWSESNQQPKRSETFLVPLRSLNTKAYSRSVSFRRRLRPCFAYEPTREFSTLGLSATPLWSRKTQYPTTLLASLNHSKEVQIIKTGLIPPILTNTFVFGLYKLQKQTYKYKEPIRNICKYLVVYFVGSVCWLYYANVSTKIEKNDSKQGWNLAQEMVQKNLPLFKNKGEKLNIFSTRPSGTKVFVHKTLDQGLQNNYTFFRETSNFSSFLVNSFSVNKILGLWSNSNNFSQRSQLGPKPFQHFFQDKITQNYIANIPVKDLRLDRKSHLNAQKEVTQTKNLFFFARRPLFFKKERSSFLSTQMLSQKEQYLCSGTAMIMGSEFDFLPRKIESTGFSNQNKSTINRVDNRHVKFSVEVTKMEKPKLYKTLSDITLDSIQNAELGHNFGFGVATSWLPGVHSKKDHQSRLEAPLQNILKEPKNCAFKMKTGEQKGYLKFLKASFLRVRSSHKKGDNTLSGDPRGSGPENFVGSSFGPNHLSGDKGNTQFSRSLNRTGIEQRNFSRTLFMVSGGTKEGTGAWGASSQYGGTNKTPNRTTTVKKKNIFKDRNLLESFCRSRLQSGFNFPDIVLLNKPVIEGEKSGTALKIHKKLEVNPERSNIPKFVRPFIKTDPTPFSIKPEFYGSHEKTKRQINNLKVDSSKSARPVNWPKSSLKTPSLAKGLKNLTNSPESFFGTSYLHLGERFTIEKIKSKNQIGFLNNVHTGDVVMPSCYATSTPSLKATLPFVSTGTSLNTVFGKKALKQESSKKAFKTQSPFTTARAVSQWHIIDFPKSKGHSSQRDHVQQNFETRGLNKSHSYFQNNSVENKKITNSSSTETQQKNTNNFDYLLYPKRISGKVNRHLINPFKYYNPGTKRDRNIEDAMLTLEGYKKSRLFPTTHINYQGISSQFLDVSMFKKNQGQYLKTHTTQDIDLQSILSGMRQKNEAQRIAEKTIGSLYENSGLQKESDLRHQEELGQTDNPTLTWENKEDNRGADSFFEESRVNLKHHENTRQKKNFRNTNNYPLGTLLAGASQTHCPKNLTTTALAEYNFTNRGINPNFLGSNASTVKFLEGKVGENSQLATIPSDSSGPRVLFWPGQKTQKAQDQRGHNSFLQGSNKTKGFYFEKIFATPILRSQPQTFRFTGGVENTFSSPVSIGLNSSLEPTTKTTNFGSAWHQKSHEPSSWLGSSYQSQHQEHAPGTTFFLSPEGPRPMGVLVKKTNFSSFIQTLRPESTSIASLKNVLTRVQVWGSLSKILFFSVIWSSYKILATPLTISNFLPATFTEAIGLQSFQKKYRIITRGNTKVDFKNLAGIEKTLSELRDLIWTFRLVGTGGPYGEYSNLTRLPYFGNSFGQQRSSVFSKTRNRLLLVGPPGTGKTLLVKALAAEANVPVIVQPVSQLRMIGGVENPVSALFHVARQIKPCIIFLDELDTLGTDINNSDKSSNTDQKIDTKLAQKYTYTLLLELDGLISSTRDLLIIGATNRPETLNPALTRAGRFETVINCNLPSQEQRLALFSLYLPRGSSTDGTFVGFGAKAPLVGFGVDAAWHHLAPLGTTTTITSLGFKAQGRGPSRGQSQNLSSSLILQSSQGTRLRSKHQKVIKNFSYLDYVTKTAYGLSQASIETAINQSALNSILQGNRCHTFTTLEQAFNAVKVLNSKTTTGKAFDSSWSFSRLVGDGVDALASVVDVASQEGTTNTNTNTNTTTSKGSSSLVDMFTSKQKNSIQNLSSGVPNIVGNKSKSILTKNIKLTSTEFDPKTDFGFKAEPSGRKERKVSQKNLQFLVCTAYQTTGPFLLSQKTTSYSKKFFKVYLTGLFKRKEFTVSKNKEDSALQSLEFALFQNYAGQACLNLYNGIRSQSLQFSHMFGLYKNPVQLGTTLFLLKNSEDGHFSTESGLLSTSWSQQDAKVSAGANGVFSTSKKQKDHYWCQNIKKENKSINKQQISSVQKTSSFFVNELSRQIRLTNPLKTGWFRMYLSRPIFRYDSSEYIENKEYYPKNNYSFYSEKQLQPLKGLVPSRSRGQRFTHFINVATLSHQTTLYEPLSLTEGSPKPRINKKAIPQVHETFGKIYRENNFVPQKFSLYLAIVAFIFHNTLLFMQENRELADYCVYKKLRYGGLYEFYIDQVCQKFR